MYSISETFLNKLFPRLGFLVQYSSDDFWKVLWGKSAMRGLMSVVEITHRHTFTFTQSMSVYGWPTLFRERTRR